MYVVHMLRATATQARKDLFRLLDAVERGEEVVLERRGVRFRLSREDSPALASEVAEPRPRLLVQDPAVLSGEWTWAADEDGQLVFVARSAEPES
jgi:hypothetical protein